MLEPVETPISDVAAVRRLLIASAKAGKAVSYAGLLDALGHRFTRPKMRALCRTLDAIDIAAAAAGEPELAVLVVREADRLPGQGWWVGKVREMGYDGLWTGAEASAFVRRQQKIAFDYWRGKQRKKARAKASAVTNDPAERRASSDGSGRSTSRSRAARRA